MRRWLFGVLVIVGMLLMPPLAAAQQAAMDGESERELQEMRRDLEGIARLTEDGLRALQSFDAFTKALDEAGSRNEELILTCSEARIAYENTKIARLKAIAKNSWLRCNKQLERNARIIDRARDKFPGIKEDIFEIKMALDEAKRQAGVIEKQRRAKEATDELERKLKNSADDIDKVKSAPGY